jgi:hypothetical protein
MWLILLILRHGHPFLQRDDHSCYWKSCRQNEKYVHCLCLRMPVVGGRVEGPPHISWPLLTWMFLSSDLPPVETTYVASLLCIKNLPLIFHTSKIGFLLDIHICWHSERQGFGPASAHTWGHPEGRTWREMRWGDLIMLCWLSSQPAASLWILFWGEEIYVVGSCPELGDWDLCKKATTMPWLIWMSETE